MHFETDTKYHLEAKQCTSHGATQPLPRNGGTEKFCIGQQSGHTSRPGLDVKNGKVVPKMARQRGSDEGGELILQMMPAGAAKSTLFPFYPA